MSVYPYALDDDTTIIRVDDNVSEIGGQNFNQVRDAIFKLERELGITPSGTRADLAEFLGISHNQDGTIKASALAAVGLVTLPIDNNDVGAHAGIMESKLTLDYSTSSLYVLIQQNRSLLNAISAMAQDNQTRLNSHIAGGPAATLRHVASHIDLNTSPNDTRDPAYNWTGLIDKDGNQRTATQVASALLQINDDFTSHQNQNIDAHAASAISVNTDPFSEISVDANNVQQALESLDSAEQTRMGIHRATMHSAGVPVDARSQVLKVLTSDSAVEIDGYGPTVVTPHSVQTYVGTFPGIVPVDSVVNGDLVVKFLTPATSDNVLRLDAQFSQVRVGDSIYINYGDGYIEAAYTVESVRFVPGVEWFVRINGNNLYNTDGAYARIDRPLFDPDIQHVVVAAPANVLPSTLQGTDFMGSITVADPRAAMVLGIGFDPNQIDSTHYKLYLQMYPTGRPEDRVITLAQDAIGNITGIDVSGNAGATPGEYTLDSIVHATNNAFRTAGFNCRFLAFQHNGNFGICMTDAINGVSFSIINGDQTTGTLVEGSYTDNVVGDARSETYDALGLGANGAGVASPAWRNSYTDSTDAQTPTLVFMPRKTRYYISNGTRRDFLRSALGSVDGYWEAQITDRTVTGSSVEVTYTVFERLDSAGLKVGKTLTVQPFVAFTDPLYRDVDYGRFMIKEVTYVPSCPGDPDRTLIKVVNGIHGNGNAIASSTPASANLTVHLYFGNDTAGFNLNNMIDSAGNSTNFHRLHEIYVNNNAQTFSHERARMKADQAAAGTLLGSHDWHISNVSPKLKGFLDSGSADLNKWVRFYVLSYDSTSGEFDGYIGRRNPLNYNIYDTGPITTARKNVPAVFYDHSGNDYVELTFIETGTTPSLISAPAYVDIEIFPTLSLDDELLLLATAEINWQPQTGQQIVERVIDRRPIGSISEKDLTQSAKDFIRAVDSHVHANGVIRGLGFVEVDPTDVSGSTMKFDGGVALVNGTIATVNPGRVRIPEIINNGEGPIVDWAICVNEQSVFEIIPLTSDKTHFFATTGGTPYYIPSVTIVELLTERKDLTLIAVTSVAIASVTIGVVTDVRKWIENESGNIPFVWVDENNKHTGNFRSFEAALWWIRNFSEVKNTLKVRGTININGVLSVSNITIDSDGYGATFVVNTNRGLLLGNNTIIRNCHFKYTQTTAPLSGNIVNSNGIASNGCIDVRFNSGSDGNVIIENNTFEGEQAEAYRWPFISVVLNDSLCQNVRISGNTFIDTNAPDNAAIVIYEVNTDEGTHSVLDNWHIEHNMCNAEQGVYIVGQATVPSAQSKAPITVRNVNISKNTCGKIGFLTSGDISQANTSVQSGLRIVDNNCHAIYTSSITGDALAASVPNVGLGNVNISRNSCAQIKIEAYQFDNPRDGYTSLIIADNLLTKTSYVTPSNIGEHAIGIFTNFSAGKICTTVANNIISSGQSHDSSTILLYDSGISITVPANITGNVISGFTGRGISSSQTSSPPTIIQGNTLYRRNNDIVYYIGVNSHCSIIGNSFDSSYVDVAETNSNAINASGNNNLILNNKNHMVTIRVPVISGNYSVASSGFNPVTVGLVGGSIESNIGLFLHNNDFRVRFYYAAADAALNKLVTFTWYIDIRPYLPYGARLDSVTVWHNADSAPDDGVLTVEVGDGVNARVTNSHAWDHSDNLSVNVNNDMTVEYSRPCAYVQSAIEHSTSFNGLIYGVDLVIVY